MSRSEVVAFLVDRAARPTPTDDRLKPDSCSMSLARLAESPHRMRPSSMPLRQLRQGPAGGPAPLGGVDLGDEQVQLTGEGMDLFTEHAVVIEGCVQSTL
jgi:hypothetical protein